MTVSSLLKSSVFTMALTLTLVGCGREKYSGMGDTAPKGDAFSDSYYLPAGTCNTGSHTFKGNSEFEVRKQLCETLLSDAKNNGCAEALRKELFAKKCPGLPWTPIYEGGNHPKPTIEEMVRKTFETVLVEQPTLTGPVFGIPRRMTELLGQFLEFCGTSLLGPKCLDFIPTNTWVEFFMPATAGQKGLVVSDVTIEVQGKKELLFAYEFQVDAEGKIMPTSARVFVKKKDRNTTQPIEDYLKDTDSAELMLTAPLSLPAPDKLALRLNNPRNIREFFHAAEETAKRALLTGSQLAGVIVSAKELLIESTRDVLYQYANYKLLSELWPHQERAQLALAEAYLAAGTDALTQLAAPEIVILAKYLDGVVREDLKEKVLSSLKNEYPGVRVRALQALGEVRVVTSDQNKVIALLADTEDEVSAAATTLVSRFALEKAHVSALSSALKDATGNTKTDILKFLGKIDDPSADEALIGKVTDSDPAVAGEALNQLRNRNLTDESVEPLTKALNRGGSDQKMSVLGLLKKIKTSKSAAAVIAALAFPLPEIRAEAFKVLETLPVGEEHLGSLEIMLTSSTPDVRRSAITFIGRIGAPSATLVLIKAVKEFEVTVRELIINLLKQRTVLPAHLNEIVDNFESPFVEVRILTAQQLGQLKTEKALKALKKRRNQEPVQAVKDEIEKAIKAIEG